MKNTAHKGNSAPEKKTIAEPVIPSPAIDKHEQPIAEGTLKKIFIGSLVAMLLVTLFCGYNAGFNGDEIALNNYGKANYTWYMSGGKDTILKTEYYKLLNSYGNAFEILAVGANKILHTDKGPNEFNIRHIINQILSIVGLLYAGLITRRFSKGWTSALFAIWLLYLTPPFMGHFLFNTRDVPFYVGYVAALYYMINFLEELPVPRWSTSIYLMLSFAFATNVRIGGFLLPIYLGIFMVIYLLSNKQLMNASLKKAGSIIIKLGVIVVGGIILIIITWPYVLSKPSGLIEALTVASKFPLKVNINFEGAAINSLNVPAYYLPKYMLVTIPIFITVCIIGGFVAYFFNFRRYDWKIAALIIFSTFFPVIYAIATHAALYSSWRHFLFIYPGLCIFGGIALQKAFTYSNKMPVKLALGVACLLVMFKPVAFCIKNNPYEYCYFNEVAGDFKSAYLSYDTDYWEISVKDGFDWLVEHEHLEETKDTVVIATNASEFANYYLSRHFPKSKIKIVQSGFTMRNSNFWKYSVFNSVFVKPDYLENYFPPPYEYALKIDDVPVTLVLKDTVRLDWKAALELKSAHHALADSLYTAYIKTTKDDNIGLYAYMAVAKGSLNKNDEAIKLAKKGLEYHLSPLLDYNAYCGMGIAYANKAEWKVSIDYLQKAMSVMPKESAAKDILKQVVAAQRQNPGPQQPATPTPTTANKP